MIAPLRCRGCGRQIGLSTGPPMVSVFCSAWCSEDLPFNPNEEKNSIIRYLAVAGMPILEIAEKAEMTRQRVKQILDNPPQRR